MNDAAGAGDILIGKSAYVNGIKITGTMANNGALSETLDAGKSFTIPAGYTSGGTVITNSLASQTSATATGTDILSGKTAWVNGSKISGTWDNSGIIANIRAKGVTLVDNPSYTEIAEAIANIPQTLSVNNVIGTVNYNYHYHVGNSNSGEGCYGTHVAAHSHSDSCYAICSKTVSYPDGGDPKVMDGVTWYKPVCPDCGTRPSRTSMTPKCETRRLTCTQTEQAAYCELNCGYADGQILSAEIIF